MMAGPGRCWGSLRGEPSWGAGGGGAHARLEELVNSERRNENPQEAYRRKWAKT